MIMAHDFTSALVFWFGSSDHNHKTLIEVCHHLTISCVLQIGASSHKDENYLHHTDHIQVYHD